MTDSESDIEIITARIKMPKKLAPPSPLDELKTSKKITTKMMITDALIELKTRKGVSLYAIKKHLTQKYNVNTEKVKNLIIRSIKAGVEDGTFIQIKGVGASGSFKLADIKEKPKPKKKKIIKPEKSEKIEKEDKKKSKIDENYAKKDKKNTKTKTTVEKKLGKPKKMEVKKDNEEKPKKKKVETKKQSKKALSENEGTISKIRSTKVVQTPSKKRKAMVKRKSIGSIIKPPRMKPKLAK